MRFSVVASFSGVIDDKWWPCDTTLQDAVNVCESVFGEDIELSEIGDSEYSYLAEDSDADFWSKLQDFQIAGILTRDQLTELLDRLGAFVNDCETMGTLGGPLGLGIVPDVDCTIESQCLISCIRITPIPNNENIEITETRWNRLASAMRAVYGV